MFVEQCDLLTDIVSFRLEVSFDSRTAPINHTVLPIERMDAFLADLDDLEEEDNQENQQGTTSETLPANEEKEEALGENESEDLESEDEEKVRFSRCVH